MYIPESGVEVMLEQKHERTTGIFQKEILIKDLKPKTYFVEVLSQEFEPWAKYLEVAPQEVVSAFPVLIPKNIVVREIVQNATTSATSTFALNTTSAEYQRIAALFKAPTTTSTIATTTLSRKKMAVWNESNVIYAEWQGNPAAAPQYFCRIADCLQRIITYSSKENIRHLDFYPNRNDVVIASFGEGVYAIETDNREYQNVYPLFMGQAPDFRMSNDSVYVKDGAFIGSIDLDV